MKLSWSGPVILLVLLVLLFGFPIAGGMFGAKTSKVETERSLAPFFLKSERSKAVLIYFGYVGCTSICIPTLHEVAPLYERLHRQFPSLSFYFVNLNPSQPSEWAEPFAKFFHNDFHGIYADDEQVGALERDFNLALVPSDSEMAHSSNLYLMIRENGGYTLKRIYVTHPYSENEIVRDLQRLYR